MLTVDNQFLNRSDKINFSYGKSYQIACISQNSVPLLSLTIFANNINLNSLSDDSNQTIVINNMASICNNVGCYSALVLNLTFNDIKLAIVNQITCTAWNTTIPFNLTSAYSIQAESKI
jgi:hypothetical protein